MRRESGILLPISSLPSPYGIGCFSREAYEFVDQLKEAGQSYWQILPLGPTSYGDSPYQSFSTFAGNPYFISLEDLIEEGVLTKEECDQADFKSPDDSIDYAKLYKARYPLLRLAYERSDISRNPDFNRFCEENDWWLSDYALFMAVKDRFGGRAWTEWATDIRLRWSWALDYYRREQYFEIEFHKYLQFTFLKQWTRLKEYANRKGIRIIGDIPIFVAPDSSDAWAERRLLLIDEDGQQEASSGVPPDAFSATGQLWGNPLYRWEEHEKTGFDWWIRRFRENLRLFDIVRIDHFRGFEACWTVPEGETTAMNGKWVKSPGQKLFDAVKAALGGDLPIIAEDLGVITPEVEELRDRNGFPGMKIAQFAFAFDNGKWQTGNPYLPHNCQQLSVAYTGTHDNNTAQGWYDELDDGMRDYVRRYLECSDGEVVWKLIRALMASNAMWVIFPMQDVLGLGADARMNVPSTCGGSNWSWKMGKEDLSTPSINTIRYYSELYGRAEL